MRVCKHSLVDEEMGSESLLMVMLCKGLRKQCI